MSANRDWKEAKPKWVVDAARAEMASMRRTLSLRWPPEAKPTASFGFGEYDREWGTVEFGTFWVSDHARVTKVAIREKLADEAGYKRIRFSEDDRRFSDCVARGHYFRTEKAARLHALWNRCEEKARELEAYWTKYEEAAE